MLRLEDLTAEAIQQVQPPTVFIDQLNEKQAFELFILRNLQVIFLPESSEKPLIYKKKFEKYIEGRKMTTDTDILLGASSSDLSPEISIDEDLLEGQIETRFRFALASILENAKVNKELPDFSELRLQVWHRLRIPEEHTEEALIVFETVASSVLGEYISQITDELIRVATAKRVAHEILALRKRLETTLEQEFESSEQYIHYAVAILLNAPELARLDALSPSELTSESFYLQTAVEQASRILSLESTDRVNTLAVVLRQTVQQLITDFGPSATRKVIDELQWSSACGECSVKDIQTLLHRLVDELATEI